MVKATILHLLLWIHGPSCGAWIHTRMARILHVPKSSLNDFNADMESVFDAAAHLTQERYSLIGTRSLGVDYGLVRTGIAVTVGYSPKPITITSDLNNTELCETIIRYAQAEQVSRIIVGLPLHKNGTLAEQTNLTVDFAKQLLAESLSNLGPSVKVELWDERYTSKEAASRLRSEDPNSSLRGTLDADSACIILEHYYNENGEGAQLVDIPEELRERCIASYKRKSDVEKDRLSRISHEREDRLQKRREAIARAKELESLAPASSNKKKKKKRKK